MEDQDEQQQNRTSDPREKTNNSLNKVVSSLFREIREYVAHKKNLTLQKRFLRKAASRKWELLETRYMIGKSLKIH